MFFTNINLFKVDKFELRGKEYNIDHIYSIKQGFYDNISPEIIGSEINLQIIESNKNYQKSACSNITKFELLKKI